MSYYLIMAGTAAESSDMGDGEKFAAVAVLFVITFSLPIWCLFKWIWYHPHVNMSKLKERLDKSNALKERLTSTEQLMIDLDLQNLEQYNIRGKGITISWSDNVSGQDRQIHFMIDGKSDSGKGLRNLAKVIHKETKKELLKTVYRLPKRHGKSEPNNVITFNDIGD